LKTDLRPENSLTTAVSSGTLFSR